MKKLTNYQRTAQYLNKVFKLINEEYFNNELEVPTITIQSTVGAYGHVSVNKVWHNDTEATHELNLSADYLNRPIENIVATLIHEGCHLYALQNNIKDNGFFSMSENFSVSTNTETSQYSLTAQLTTDITQSQSSKTASDTENNSEN